MKKIIITTLFLLGIFSQNCFGQLKVDSLGHVAVGTLNTTNSLLTIGQGYGNSIYTATITPPTGKGGLYIQNRATSSSPLGNVGLSITNNNNLNTSSYGIQINWNHLDGYSSPKTYSIYTEAGGSSVECYGVAATLSGLGSAYGAAIIGSTSSTPTLQHSGQYAGYFIGNVRTTGSIFSNLLSPSPSTLTSQITVLDEDKTGENIVDKLVLLKPTQLISDSEPQKPIPEEEKRLAEDLGVEVPQESVSDQTRMSSVRYSIEEESLSKMFPELVYKDADGNVLFNYIEMVPLLVQSIKELNAKITDLQQQLETK